MSVIRSGNEDGVEDVSRVCGRDAAGSQSRPFVVGGRIQIEAGVIAGSDEDRCGIVELDRVDAPSMAAKKMRNVEIFGKTFHELVWLLLLLLLLK